MKTVFASWKLNRARAQGCKLIICTRNSRGEADPSEVEHGAGFLIAKIDRLESYARHDGVGVLVRFSEYATLDLPHLWDGSRFPVRYVKLADLDIDPASLEWHSMPQGRPTQIQDGPLEESPPEHDSGGLTIAEAKQRLAQSLGLSPEQVEITIRG